MPDGGPPGAGSRPGRRPMTPHGHGHSHDVGRPGGRRRREPADPRQASLVRAVLAAAVAVATIATVVGLVLLWPRGERPTAPSALGTANGLQLVDGTVASVRPYDCTSTGDAAAAPDAPAVTCAYAMVALPGRDGVEVDLAPDVVQSGVSPGDRVRLAHVPASADAPETWLFLDFVRGLPLAALAISFALLVVLVARLRGLAALVGLVVTGIAVLEFMLPALLVGRDPLLVGVVGSSAILLVVLYLAHGVSVRTTTALLGTLFGVALTALLATWAGAAAHLTGVGSEGDASLVSLAGQIDLSGLLVCGVVLAGLGVLNDVTITQASAVWELHELQPGLSARRLFGSAMRIGRDHIASTVYTIVFAYAGAALPVLLLIELSTAPLSQVVVSGDVAAEVVRSLVGAIGLVLAVPLTTGLGVLVVRLTARRPAG
nr:YibE/F family protein [Motilibacter deserti]